MIDTLKTILIEAITSFDKKANELIGLLGDEHDLNLESENPFGKLIKRDNNLWKGELKGTWIYQFHGGACKFENKITGQLVDVKINRRGNYGAIDDFYLFKYIETSKELDYIFEKINSEISLINLLAELEKENIIIDIGDSEIHQKTRILNYKLLRQHIG
jgi:hypothetical protein